MQQATSTATATPTPMPALVPLEVRSAIGCCEAFVELGSVVAGEEVSSMVEVNLLAAISSNQLDLVAPFQSGQPQVGKLT